MNKVLFHTIFALGCLSMLAACGNDDITNDVDMHTVKVVSAKTSFDALGGTDSIIVEGDVKQAYAVASWAKAEAKGSLVTVTAEVNNDMQSRHTTVVIKTSDADSTVVAIDQLGPITQIDVPENLVLGDEANTVSYKVKSTFDIKVSSPDSWITAKYAKGVMTVSTTANNDGHLRRGKIVIESMAGKDTIKVTQVDFDRDLLGSYYLQMDETDENKQPVTRRYAMKLVKQGKKLVLKLGTSGIAVPVTYDAETASLSIASNQQAGKYKDYFVGTIVGPSKNQLYFDSSVTISGAFFYSEKLATKAPELDGTVLTFGKTAVFVFLRTFLFFMILYNIESSKLVCESFDVPNNCRAIYDKNNSLIVELSISVLVLFFISPCMKVPLANLRFIIPLLSTLPVKEDPLPR